MVVGGGGGRTPPGALGVSDIPTHTDNSILRKQGEGKEIVSSNLTSLSAQKAYTIFRAQNYTTTPN